MNGSALIKQILELQASGDKEAPGKIRDLLYASGYISLVDGQLVKEGEQASSYLEGHPIHLEQSGIGGR